MMDFETKMNALLAESNKQSDRPMKRVRLTNFTERENEVLVNLAHQEVDIIENKKTDQASNTLKTEVWHAITEVFNSHRISERRDMVSLRTRYENLKRRLRRRIMDQKAVLGEGETVQMVATNYEAKLWEMMVSKPDGVEIVNDDVIEIYGSGNKIQFIQAEDLDEEQADILGINYDGPEPQVPRTPSVSSVDIKGEASRDSTREANSDEDEARVRPSPARISIRDTTTTSNAPKNNLVVNPSEVRQYLNSAGRVLDGTLNRQYRPTKPKPSTNTTEIGDAIYRLQEEEHQLKMKLMKEEHEAKMKILTQELKMKEEQHAINMKILKRKLIVICEDL